MVVLSIAAAAVLGAAGVAGLANYPPIPKDLTTPVQQRLAFHANNAVAVGWSTYEKMNMSCVEYGTSSSSLNQKACANTSVTYPTSRTWSNFVTLTGLSAGTTYYYKIVSGNSSVGSFKAALVAGDMEPFNATVMADLGVYGENGYTVSSKKKRDLSPAVSPELNHTTIAALARTIDEYDFVIHPGDFAYADDWYYNTDNVLDEKNVYEAILENFYDQLASIAANKPYMTGPGNHEAVCVEDGTIDHMCPNGQKNFTDYMQRFGRAVPTTFKSQSKNQTAVQLAQKAAGLALPPMWYSFEYGMAHIVMFNTETDFFNAPDTHGSYDLDVGPFGSKQQQINFLEADLASVDRSVTPWLIVAGHRPWYSTGGYGNQCFACQNAFEEIFYKYGVDAAMFGHVHNAQRFLPMYNNKTDSAGMNNPKAALPLVMGGPGNIEGLSAIGSNLTGNVFAYNASQTYARLQFMSKQKLGVYFYRSNDSSLLDSSVLYKEHDVAFVVQ